MKSIKLLFVAVWSVSVLLPLEARTEENYPIDYKDLCKTVENESVPKVEMPSEDELKVLGTCDSEALFYGIGRKSDPKAARVCAFKQSDNLMLATIFSSGSGVKRNNRLAKKFACRGLAASGGGVTSQIFLMFEEIEKGTRDHFDVYDAYCEDGASRSVDECKRHRNRLATAKPSKS